MISAIACVNNDWAIGKNNKLLYNIKNDLEHFKYYTKDKVVVMGRKTLQSLPGGKPLPGRINIVLASDGFICEGAVVVHSLEFLKMMIESINNDLKKDVVIIGGGQLYHALLDLCETVKITHVDDSIDADDLITFPDLTKLSNQFYLKQEDTTCWQRDRDTGLVFRYETFRNANSGQIELNIEDNSEKDSSD